jgi:hypothetical protein
VVVGNSRTYGKTLLLKEFASRRKDFSPHTKGPALYTDLIKMQHPADVKKLMLKTIAPYFFDLIPLTYFAG